MVRVSTVRASTVEKAHEKADNSFPLYDESFSLTDSFISEIYLEVYRNFTNSENNLRLSRKFSSKYGRPLWQRRIVPRYYKEQPAKGIVGWFYRRKSVKKNFASSSWKRKIVLLNFFFTTLYSNFAIPGKNVKNFQSSWNPRTHRNRSVIKHSSSSSATKKCHRDHANIHSKASYEYKLEGENLVKRITDLLASKRMP